MQQVSFVPMRTATNFQQAREAAKAFQGKPLINQQTGMTAVVSRNRLDKMLSESAVSKSESPAVHSTAVANADSLFVRAILGWSKADRNADINFAGIHRFFAPMRVDGQFKMVKMTVKESSHEGNATLLYTIEAVKFTDEMTSSQWLEQAAREDGVDFKQRKTPAGEWVPETKSRATLEGVRP